MKDGPESCKTLTELLKYRAEQSPESPAFIIDDKFYSCSWLRLKCLTFSGLLKAGEVEEKDRVIIAVPNSASFFIAFYGCILCGAIPVPVFPGAAPERISQLAGLCGSRHVIIPENLIENWKVSFPGWSEGTGMIIHPVSESAPHQAVPDIYDPTEKDIAFIQYTSGSSDFPKGVPITHAAVMTNIRQMTEAMAITGKDVFVSWLPVYHDMGLILNTMVPLYTGALLVLLQEGLHRVHSWLKTIEQYRGTFISAPDIAYRLCAKSIRRPEDYDLSSLRVALNASEPIHLQTYRLFEKTFHLKNVMVSGYGLAEATVGVTMHPPSQPPVVDADGYVSSGKPLKGIEILIKQESSAGSDLRAGEILVKSPAQMKGYFNCSAHPEPFDPSGFLRTGDAGYLDNEGYLYVLARKKNIIKHAGHTLYPDDVEEVVKSIDEIRNAAAIGIEDPVSKTESLFLFAELKSQKFISTEQWHDIAIGVAAKIAGHFGIRPGKVFLMKPKSLPVTTNGKLQHQRLRSDFLNDIDRLREYILYPEQTGNVKNINSDQR